VSREVRGNALVKASERLAKKRPGMFGVNGKVFSHGHSELQSLTTALANYLGTNSAVSESSDGKLIKRERRTLC
jgi:hypothetical protein